MATITARVTRTERRGHTNYGNPRFTVGLEEEDGTCHVLKLSDNAALCYAIDNPEYKNDLHTFELTKSGHLSGVVRKA